MATHSPVKKKQAVDSQNIDTREDGSGTGCSPLTSQSSPDSPGNTQDVPLASLLHQKSTKPQLCFVKNPRRRVNDTEPPKVNAWPSYFSPSSSEEASEKGGLFSQSSVETQPPLYSSGVPSKPVSKKVLADMDPSINAEVNTTPGKDNGETLQKAFDSFDCEIKTLVPPPTTGKVSMETSSCSHICHTESGVTGNPLLLTINSRERYWRFDSSYQLESPRTPNQPVSREALLARRHQTWGMPAIRPDELLLEGKYPLTAREEQELSEMCFDHSTQESYWKVRVSTLLNFFPKDLQAILAKEAFPPGWDEFSEFHKAQIRSYSYFYNKFLLDFDHRVPVRVYIIYYFLSKVARLPSSETASHWKMDKEFEAAMYVTSDKNGPTQWLHYD